MRAPVVKQDAAVWTLFLGLLVMFVAGSMAKEHVFAGGLLLTMAAVAHMGFGQWTGRPWIPVTIMAVVLGTGLALVLALASQDVLATGTVLGFHPATAALVYVIWIPAFFTLGLAFVIVSKGADA